MKKLTYSNQWEVDIYKVGDKTLRSLKKVMIDGNTYKVKGNEVSVPYMDMGHRYTAVSTHYFIKEKVFGLPMSFDLNTLVGRKAVYAIEYEVE